MTDEADLKILRELQKNCSQGLEALGEAVGMSTASCHRRIKKMEADKVILGKNLLLDEKKLGVQVTAMITIQLDIDTFDVDVRMQKIVQQQPEVMGCYLLSGDCDFVLIVKFSDVNAYTDYIYHFLETYKEIPIKTYSSKLVVRKVKEISDIPI
ncbi:DNA-binding transcriptional activator DecR [Sinobacterium norvegicum]|uniref:DNA-binding transcriptional activator DecR n=1 Tax=Sinobacterium norvegicum TaxID=1641715 RepID=A0ABN8EFB9_9GAMM|nr:Lrp/AsnC family transcriptional regulator [Sinobacterium norvegicum]CAH0991022.1 DNA-binding transcriptional activator DecR [Sinobacterium norvegicum]